MERMGQVIWLKPEIIAEYKRMHAAVWPAVLNNCRLGHPKLLDLLKRTGKPAVCLLGISRNRFCDRLAKMKLVPQMQDWWKITDPMQAPCDIRKPGEWWAGMELVFHTD